MKETVQKVFTIQPEFKFKLEAKFLKKFQGQQPNWGYGALSYVTFLRTYSRRLGNGKQEEYWQTCKRVVEGISSIIKQRVSMSGQAWDDAEEQHHAQEMFQRMWDFKFTPPGRGLWFMGTEAMELKGGGALNNCGFVSTENVDKDFAEPFCALMDFSMLGVGMGFDTLGAGKITIERPLTNSDKHEVPDTREGWIACVRRILRAYVGLDSLPQNWDFSKIRKEGLPLKTFGGTSSGYGPLEELINTLQTILNPLIGKTITSTVITDIMNLIGRCVVAGNVRRSSEIALGDPSDEEFVGLKDPTLLNEIRMKQAQILSDTVDWDIYEVQVQKLRKQQKKLSVLSREYANLQTKIDVFIKFQKEIAKTIPEWNELEAKAAKHPLMTYRWASNNTVLCSTRQDYSKLAPQTAMNGEPGYGWMDIIRAYGRLADPPNWADREAKGFNPCGEQTLHDRELCCLVETYPTKHDSLEDFLTTLKYAYRYAKAVTLVPTHDKNTNSVMVRNRRIGTSMAGIIEMYCKLGIRECIRWWEAGFREIVRLDDTYSKWLDVHPSIKHTSIKPGGTVPLLVGVEGGMKAPTAKYYMRTIRIGSSSKLAKQLKNAGYRVEPDRTTPRTLVVYFPVKAPEGVRTSEEIGLWEQAMIFTALQKYWADNMVSATLTVSENEKDEIIKVLEAYEGKWKAVSFLPLFTHGFIQAPYIPCTEQEFDLANSKIKPLFNITVEHDTDEKWCSGGICEIPAVS